MKIKGKWHGQPYWDYANRRWLITFEIKEKPDVFDKTKDKDLNIEISEHKKNRSIDANRLMWECLGRIASALNSDKWSIYLQMLKRYGKFTYICVKPEVVEAVKKQWRECEEIGEIDINGQKAMQLLCYFGSSTYNTNEFSVLLDGIISEMREMGIQTPSDDDFERAIKSWKNNGK